MIQELGGSFTAGEGARGRTFQPKEEILRWILSVCISMYLKGGNEDEGPRPLPVEPSDKGRDYGHKLKHGRFCLNIRRQFSCEGGQTMG